MNGLVIFWVVQGGLEWGDRYEYMEVAREKEREEVDAGVWILVWAGRGGLVPDWDWVWIR